MLTPILLAAKVGATGTDDENAGGLAVKIADFFDFLISQIPNWIAAVIVFVLTFAVAKIVKSAIESRIEGQIDEEHQEILVLAGRVSYYGTVAVGITVALKIAGIDLTALLAAVAFGIGFALRDLIMNFISGVIILLSKQFAIGDFIKVGNTVGKVMEIQTRATIIKAVDGTKVIIPNADIFTKEVISLTTNPLRRVSIPLYVSYDTDLSYAIEVAMETIKKNSKILKKPPPTVIIKNYGGSTIDLEARFWTSSHGWFHVKSEMMHKLWDAFNEAGIVVPYDVMHIETEQDTSVERKEYFEKAKLRMEEMAKRKMEKAAQKEAKEALGSAPTSVTPTAQISVATVPVPVQVHPEGEFLDQVEADGQG